MAVSLTLLAITIPRAPSQVCWVDGGLHWSVPWFEFVDGVASREARRRKERVHPELTGVGGRARLVVIAGEVGGRWSSETAHFLSSLATAKVRSVPQVWQVRAGMVRAARLFALSLGEVRASPGVDGEIPSVHAVVGDFHCSGAF